MKGQILQPLLPQKLHVTDASRTQSTLVQSHPPYFMLLSTSNKVKRTHYSKLHVGSALWHCADSQKYAEML